MHQPGFLWKGGGGTWIFYLALNIIYICFRLKFGELVDRIIELPSMTIDCLITILERNGQIMSNLYWYTRVLRYKLIVQHNQICTQPQQEPLTVSGTSSLTVASVIAKLFSSRMRSLLLISHTSYPTNRYFKPRFC